MKNADIVIIGGGMVGLAFAAQLADQDCQIKIIEKTPAKFDPHQITNRVSAINFSSQTLLENIGVWQLIAASKRAAYQQMQIIEQDSFAKIHFDNNDLAIKSLGLNQLGVIIENQHIQHALWQKVSQQTNVEILFDEPKSLGINEQCAFLTLASGQILTAKLLVGADGANSWVRKQSDIPLISRDYQHTALVCTVKTAEPHQQTARQVFAPESILAFLPLPDPQLCSIVWSLPPEKAQTLQQCEVSAFNKALTIAFDHQLGLTTLQSSREIYPLTARYARDFAKSRLALIGDAAHTIHPLAGLGVNLGFSDTQSLAQAVKKQLILGNDIGEYRHLRYFERSRKAQAVKVLLAMESLKQLFSHNDPAKKLLRGLGLSLTNQLPFIKRQLIEQACCI